MIDLRLPAATYRLQFNRQFRLKDAIKLVPYLFRLGISDLYASPVFQTRPGSPHGYDVTDPTHLNPELGTETDFEALSNTLNDQGMGLLLDIVPNHMAASPENPWWLDVLENGTTSPYSGFFDIDWSAGEGRVLLPILNSPFREALENRELVLTIEDAGIFVYYHDYRLPVCLESCRLVIGHRLDTLEATSGSKHPDFQHLERLISEVQSLPALDMDSECYRKKQALKKSLLSLITSSPRIKTFLLENISLFNGRKREPESFGLLRNLLEKQVYRLAFWRTERERINYRRFFDINDLIGLRVEETAVFETTHSLVLKLVREGKVSGLRIDHIDGLNDPFQYLSRLQQYISGDGTEIRPSPRFYVVVEKILSGDETLPKEWPVSGTTGYDFASLVNSLFVDWKRAQALDEIYHRFTGLNVPFIDVVYRKKKQVIKELFPGEINSLGQQLAHLAHQHNGNSRFSFQELTGALTEVTACLPVYRTYLPTPPVSPHDRRYIKQAVAEARRRNPHMESDAIDFLQRVLTLDFPTQIKAREQPEWLRFVLRWQQLTGAVMAKGYEDTALYSYNSLLSLNEVGSQPESPGLSAGDFHQRNLARLEHYPDTLNATSTHDTKRSEDVRARINVLSEMPGEWESRLKRWRQWNQPQKLAVNEMPVPEPNTEILLYQTMLGAWPLAPDEIPGFKERLKAYLVKAVREAKARTSWLSPDLDYENALIQFIDSILEEDSGRNPFLEDFLRFEKTIAFYGALNSLAQVLLKITLPGIPDFYQGTELWDFSLVDPDNRRPVDFTKRRELLDSLIRQEADGQPALLRQMLSSWQDGRVKLYVTCKALNTRKSLREVFQRGQYIPLQINGQNTEHVFSFARREEDMWVLVVVPRLLSGLVLADVLPLGEPIWENDRLLFPPDMPGQWASVFTGETLRASTGEKDLPLADILRQFPLALLVSR